jgi:hypothetical protein
VTSLLLAVIIVCVAQLAGGSVRWGALALAAPVPGLFHRRWLHWGVSAWNKGTAVAVASMRTYVIKVAYRFFVVPLDRAGVALDRVSESPMSSRWIPRVALPSSDITTSKWTGNGLLASSGRPGRGWMRVLVPVSFLLMKLRADDHDTRPPAATYTLY